LANVALNIVVGGEEKAKQAIKELNGNLKQLGTNMKSLDEVFAGNQNSYDYLSAKLKNLTEAQEAYRKKTETLPDVIKFLRDRQKELADNTDDLKQKMEQATAAYDNAENKTAALKRAMNEATKEFNDNQKALNYARDAANDYQRQLTEAEGKVDVLGEEIRKTNGYLKEAAVSADGTATSIDRYGKEVKDAGEDTKSFSIAAEAVAKLLTASGIAMGVKKLTELLIDCGDAAIEFESAFAGVEKTVDGTDEELQKISDGIKELATEIPITTTELAKIAETAGQLGQATENILGFTEVVAALSVTTDLSAEEAAISLARIANITGLMADEYSNFGSALVALGNDSAAFESEIMAMTNRLAGTGSIVEATEAQLLGIATTLVSVGVEAEAGGTAFSKLLRNIELAVESGSAKVKQYADVAGMSAQDFSNAWREDAVGAVTAFIEGLGELDSQGQSSIVILNEMGLTETRLQDAISKLSEADGLLTKNIELSNQAWKDNNALTEEAEKRYETTESKITLAKTAINNLKITIGDELLEAFDGFIGKFTDLVTAADNYIKKNPEVITNIKRLKAALNINEEAVEVRNDADDIVSSLQTLQKEYGEAADFTAKKSIFSESKRLFDELSGKIDEYGKAAKESSTKLADLREEQRLLLEQSNETYEDEMAAASKAAGLQLRIQEETESIESYVKASNALREQQKLTAEALAEWETEFEDVGEVLEETPKAVQKAEDAFADFRNELKGTGSAAKEVLNSLTAAVESGFNKDFVQSLYKGGAESQSILTNLVAEFRRLEDEYGKGSEQAKEFVAEWNAAWNESGASTAYLEAAAANLFGTLEKTSKTTTEKVKATTDTTKKAVDEAADALKKNTSDVKTALDSLTKEYESTLSSTKSALGGIGGLFGEVAFTTEKSIDDMIRGLETQADYMTGYMQNIQRAAQIGLDEGLIAALSDGSNESAGYIQKIINEFGKLEAEYGTNSAEAEGFVERFNNAFRGSSEAQDALAHTLTGITTDFDRRKEEVLTSAKDLVTQLEGYTGDSYGELAEAVAAVMTDVTSTLGNIKTTVEQKKPEVVGEFASMRGDIEKEFDGIEESGEEVGENFTDGVAKGVEDGTVKVEKAVETMAKNMVQTVNEELQIRSPSKVGAQQGEYYDEGIAEGIEDGTPTVVKAAKEMVNDLESATEKVAAAAGTSLGQTIAENLSKSMLDGLHEAIAKGQAYVTGANGEKIPILPSTEIQVPEDFDREAWLESMYAEGWNRGLSGQDIVNLLNAGVLKPPDAETLRQMGYDIVADAMEAAEEGAKLYWDSASLLDSPRKPYRSPAEKALENLLGLDLKKNVGEEKRKEAYEAMFGAAEMTYDEAIQALNDAYTQAAKDFRASGQGFSVTDLYEAILDSDAYAELSKKAGQNMADETVYGWTNEITTMSVQSEKAVGEMLEETEKANMEAAASVGSALGSALVRAFASAASKISSVGVDGIQSAAGGGATINLTQNFNTPTATPSQVKFASESGIKAVLY
jgi:TP901 family phage tail tape measure protein